MRAEVPTIVASFQSLNQQSVLPSATVFTPTSDGVFRIAVYLDFSPANVGGGMNSVSFAVRYTDDFSNQVIPAQRQSNASSGFYAGEQLVKLKAGQPVTVSVDSLGSQPTTYNLYVTVEDLN